MWSRFGRTHTLVPSMLCILLSHHQLAYNKLYWLLQAVHTSTQTSVLTALQSNLEVKPSEASEILLSVSSGSGG